MNIDMETGTKYFGKDGFYGFGDISNSDTLVIGQEFAGNAEDMVDFIKAWEECSRKPIIPMEEFYSQAPPRTKSEFLVDDYESNFGEKNKSQATYSNIAKLILALNKESLELDCVKAFQKTLGSPQSKISMIEILPWRCKNVAVFEGYEEYFTEPITKGYKEDKTKELSCDRWEVIKGWIELENIKHIIIYGNDKAYFSGERPDEFIKDRLNFKKEDIEMPPFIKGIHKNSKKTLIHTIAPSRWYQNLGEFKKIAESLKYVAEQVHS